MNRLSAPRAPAAGVLLLALGLGCQSDYDKIAQSRILSTSLATFDAGMVAVNDRERVRIFLRSTGAAPVEIYDMVVEDTAHWEVDPNWKNEDYDGDGAPDGLVIAGGSDEDPIYSLVEVIFKPDAEGEFRSELTIFSNDTEVAELETAPDGEEYSAWKVILRGIGRFPCGRVFPAFHDFGSRPPGGYFSTQGVVENCGVVTLTVTAFEIGGDAAFSVSTPPPIYVLPGEAQEFEIAYQPGGVSGGETATITVKANDENVANQPVRVVGNACELSVDTSWDDDGDGFTVCGGDCDDTDSSISPAAVENSGNSEDDNCDGRTDETANNPATDGDGDGVSEEAGDCNDADPLVAPGVAETINQIDDDCDGRIDEGTEWFDDDGDGLSERDGDCVDTDNLIVPGATENQNEIDDDCDGLIDEGSYTFDDDRDGYAEVDPTGSTDCDDDDAWSFPGAVEDCDDHDNDCDGLIDEGEDDSPDGACGFLVERVVVVDTDKGGCSTPVGAVGGGLAGLGLLMSLGRRRRA